MSENNVPVLFDETKVEEIQEEIHVEEKQVEEKEGSNTIEVFPDINLNEEKVGTEVGIEEVLQEEESIEQKVLSDKTILEITTVQLSERIIQEALDSIKNKYSKDIKIDKSDLVHIVTSLINFASKKNLDNQEKHELVLRASKVLIEASNLDYQKLQPLLDKTIHFVFKIAKEKKINVTKKTVTDVQQTFNEIYNLLCLEIEKKYPKTDDIINHLFDISNFIIQTINQYKNLTGTQKKNLFKNILNKFVDTIDIVIPQITDQQIQMVKDNIEEISELSLISLQVYNGNFEFNQENQRKITNIILQCFLKCFGKTVK